MPPDDPAPDQAREARKLPRADVLLRTAGRAGHVSALGHEPVMEAVRRLLDGARARVLAGAPCPPAAELEADLLRLLEDAGAGSLRPVVNATGVVLHTNLGRAPLSEAALRAVRDVGGGYSTLELDLAAGVRGDRYAHASAALRRLTGAEDALVVNNGAAAVLLALSALCERARGADGAQPPPAAGGLPEVVISRGQLVEIGGGFRIPDVLRRSGAALVEVGTTNRTYARDYEAAVGPRTRMLLSVHRSNFRVTGFVHDAELAELVELAGARGLWVVDDLGSGTLLRTDELGLPREPTVQERVAAGADVVCFSGDKLLGGPQAGLLVGRREALQLLRRHPLLRALRVDKATLAALGATLAHYERGEALTAIPVWRAIAAPPDDLAARARAWRERCPAGARAEVRPGLSAIGGGSLPGVTLPTSVLALPCAAPDDLAAALRRARPPVLARIEEGAVVLDPRTVLPGEDDALAAAVRAALAAV